jgi:CRISPR-associated protein (TIGR02710 family)
LTLKPSIVYLLHSAESIDYAMKVKEDKYIKDLGTKFRLKEVSEYDAKENYKLIKDILDEIGGHKRIVVDATAGRKMMVSSLSLTSFYFHLPMVYLHAKEFKNTVLPFSEILREVENPFDYYGDYDLKLVEELFNSHFYDAAIKTCEGMLSYIKDPATSRKIELLNQLISVYRDWDAFMHSKFSENNQREKPLLSERLRSVVDEFKKFNLQDNLPKNVQNNIAFLEALDKSFKNSLNIVDEYRIVDIYLSALRKGTEKQAKYDDGIARLYRCVEMCFTYRLKDLGLNDVSEPDYDKLCEKVGISVKELQSRFRKFSGRELRFGEPLALDNQVHLLKSLIPDDKMVKIYEDMKDEIKMRNRSILAHGTRPSTEKDWEAFKKKTALIVKCAIGEDKFEELAGAETGSGWHGKISLHPKK